MGFVCLREPFMGTVALSGFENSYYPAEMRIRAPVAQPYKSAVRAGAVGYGTMEF